MCDNCAVVNYTFKGASSDSRNLIPVYELLNAMVEQGRLQLYAGDCPFEDFKSVLSKEEHYTYYFYLKCSDCGEIFELAVCIRSSSPHYEKVDNIDEINIENILWGREGLYFNK